MTNRTWLGRPFDEQVVRLVWGKGKVDLRFDATIWRQDTCGTWMLREEYGDRSSIFGWEIDHIVPLNQGGSDDLENLRPLNWRNNEAKGNTYPWKCSVMPNEGHPLPKSSK
ncbi:MAG TPA: HNH endonuclease signature motif containing protein [Steroidobacteraceae bacterium]